MSASKPSWFGLLRDSLWHHGRIHGAVALGVLAGTAVLVGALLVGDSVRGSLRHLALDRLGRIDEALLTEPFFDPALATALLADPNLQGFFSDAVPIVLAQGSANHPDHRLRANQVTLLGIDERFGSLSADASEAFATPAVGEVVLNQPLAEALQAAVGDEVLIRLPAPSEIPSDSPLGRKTETVASRRLTVKAILPAQGVGRFSLRPNQQAPRNAYLHRQQLADALQQSDRVNALLVAGRDDETPSDAAHAALQAALRPTLDDFGLELVETPRGYFNFGSRRMLLSPPVDQAARRAFADLHSQPVLTYLANSIALGDKEIPYSTIAGIDLVAEPPLGPFLSPDGEPIAPLADDQIMLNQWAAADLDAMPGDLLRITFFEPESTHGEVRERTVEMRVAAICQLAGPARDPQLTPELPGVTDQLSIANWNPPFPYDSERIRRQDEDYWDEYRATPKAFVSLATARRLWSSRFGDTTSIRIPPAEGLSVESLTARFDADPATLGFEFQPVKRQALQASSGTTPFNALFIGFSFFIIAAAVMLVMLLFRLGIDQRASEVGTLLAVGWRRRQVRGLLLGEGAVVSVAGGLAGAVAGVGYAWLMLAGLRTWWVQAITTPFLELYITKSSLLIGYTMGVAVALLAIAWALRQMRRASIRGLMSGRVDGGLLAMAGRTRWAPRVGWVCLAIGAVGSAAALNLSAEAQAGAFFGSASLVLVALLAFVWARLRNGETAPLIKPGGWPLLRLAVRNAARNPARSTLTIALVASASFLIVAISAFRLDPPEEFQNRQSGAGGFALVGQSDQPLFQDLNSDEGRFDLGFSSRADKQLANARVYNLRRQEGEDASCLNLYQTGQPQVLGLPETLIERGGFAWAAVAGGTAEERANPWLLLNRQLPDDDQGRPVVPVVIDAATAMYSLHLSGVGARYTMTDGAATGIVFEVVGLLNNSLLQGALMISEQQFLRHFPTVNGYRFFLIETPTAEVDAVRQTLVETLGDYGFDATRSDVRLAEFLAVQNTYLSTFQSLGGLGLLLGTFGLGVVQLRNVLERRGELALLRAAGFRRGRLARMVLYENFALLVSGLGVGSLAALVAIIPHLVEGAASIPWLSLAATLGLVLAVGLIVSLLAIRSALAAPLLPALRGE